MGLLDSIFSSTIGKVIGAIGTLIDKNSTTEEERLAGHAQLALITAQAEAEMAKFDVQFAELQSKVIIAEAQSQSWMTRNWRPITMLTFAFVVLYSFIGPSFGAVAVDVPSDLWSVIKLGLTGYIAGRSTEAVAKTVVTAFQKKK